eukprot:6518529-Pyramimonas_sp.AAC.1
MAACAAWNLRKLPMSAAPAGGAAEEADIAEGATEGAGGNVEEAEEPATRAASAMCSALSPGGRAGCAAIP